jgi:hypothetical protein
MPIGTGVALLPDGIGVIHYRPSILPRELLKVPAIERCQRKFSASRVDVSPTMDGR